MRALGVMLMLSVAAGCGETDGVEAPVQAGAAPLGPDLAAVGRWLPLHDWPDPHPLSSYGYGAHLHVLPNGKVLFWGDPDAFAAQPKHLWTPPPIGSASTDPGTFTPASSSGYDQFCSSHAFLRDGRLMVNGGHLPHAAASRHASIYDPVADSWTPVRDMNTGRWYSTTTTLADGDLLVVSGAAGDGTGENLLPQIWRGAALWRNLAGDLRPVSLGGTYYPWMYQAPNGLTFMAGPLQFSAYLDTSGSGDWTDVSTALYNRSAGTSVMYEPGKILTCGGETAPATAERIDLTLPTPSWQWVDPMAHPRVWPNSTLLPDGTVLVTGGGTLETELWDPLSGDWRGLAPQSVIRGYHSTAALLPDGRVVSAGSNDRDTMFCIGAPGNRCDYSQIFEPPYLFQGPRPEINYAPATVVYGQSFLVGTWYATSIAQVTLVRLSSVTHSFNMNQRFLRLDFTVGGDYVSPTAPAAPELAPPGHYMLFLVDGAGVPSVAAIVRLTEPALADALQVDGIALPASDANGVFEPGETVRIAPSWRNPLDGPLVALTGTAANFTGPASGTYSIIDGAAGYGTILAGAAQSCTSVGDCYRLRVIPLGARPTHWDATFDEQTNAGEGHTWNLHLGDSFPDVPRSSPYYRFVETLLHNGVTEGCGAGLYCPASSLTKGEMARMTLLAMHGPGYAPRGCQEDFLDLPASDPLCPWAEEMVRREIVIPCYLPDPPFFCPDHAVTRATLARSVLATLEGSDFEPPLCIPGMERFTDVPASDPDCPWIEELARRGVVAGCSPTTFCPTAVVPRDVAAVFLTGTFQLPLYER